MSFAPIGAGSNVSDVFRQMVEQFLLGMQISSAGGDSPKINTVVNLPEVGGFGGSLDNAIRIAVLRYIEEAGLRSTGGGGTQEEKGFGEAEAVGLASKGLATAQNPVSLVSQALPLLPHAIVIAFVVSLMPTIINELTKPGGPYDLRFKRIMTDEFNALQDRQVSYDVRIGHRGLIFQSVGGFLSHNQTGVTSTNTLRLIRDGGINKDYQTQVDYVDHSRGLF